MSQDDVLGFWPIDRDSSLCVFFHSLTIKDIKEGEGKTKKQYKQYMLALNSAFKGSKQTQLQALFPWHSAAEFDALYDFYDDNTRWRDLWNTSSENLWWTEPRITPEEWDRRRTLFFTDYVCAIWPIDGTSRCLVHLRSSFSDNEHDFLSRGFIVFDMKIVDDQLLRNKKIELLSEKEKLRIYPWTTGAKGLEIVTLYRDDPLTTIQMLKLKKKKGNYNSMKADDSTNVPISAPDDGDSNFFHYDDTLVIESPAQTRQPSLVRNKNFLTFSLSKP